MNLSLLVLLPLATALAILFCKGLKQVRAVALTGSVAQLGICAWLLFLYMAERNNGNSALMLFETSYTWFRPLQVNYHTGVDGISLAMILLTASVVVAGILVSWTMEKLSKEFFFLLVLLSLGAYGFFISLDLFTLFFFLEIAVIPKFLLIGIWGSGKKEYSAMKLALMLMAGSALVFVGLVGLYYNTHSFDIMEISRMKIPVEVQKFFFPFAFLGFGIFAALFPFHTWVPDGHASAPTAASMFLAGISMKLGGYGCLRVATFLMPDAAHAYAWVIILLATIAIIYGAFATMMQTDLKYINAYSSVSHCGFVILGIGMLTETSINGAVLQMVSHGLMTALFFAAIGMIYSRTHTRMVSQLGGLLKVMPFVSTIFVIAGLCSLGLPGFSGFVAEMTVFMGAWENPDKWYRLATILACASIVVTAVYILRAAGKTIMGPMQETYASLHDATWNEKLAAVVLMTGILVVGVAPFLINQLIHPSTTNIMRQVGAVVVPK
ncbi:NADH-quinone oxidoreductase subunit M [Sediminibacterium roseum]|uniref:NADH-quinone oxidoreductase subunit M n=1 Tax=Sediminibacterium roseum TaxID=1978412 RepID=A0ABX0A0G2_9BACT|nr:NADH-quinone oxidoreductase subunit M [Sediminibacterium roseum]NCI51432.1 NADH-quinone oxidoreductase subunit M [Sediminibacterium roseum]